MKGFISYSHVDHSALVVLQRHVKAIERAYTASFWTDKRITPGYYWDKSIEDAIKDAQVFILLISPGFIASDYIYDREIPAIKARHSAGALVLPVVLKRCMWELGTNALQAVPIRDGSLKPIHDWVPHENGFDSARTQMAGAIATFFGMSPASVDWSTP